MKKSGDLLVRKMSPTLTEIEDLSTPLNSGELKVLNFFNNHLDVKWEIYSRPPLNGISPTFVLLHPENGIAVFDVRSDLDDHFFTGSEPYNLIQRVKLYRSKIQEICGFSGRSRAFGIFTAGLVLPQWSSDKISEVFDVNFRTTVKFRSDKYLGRKGQTIRYTNNLIIGETNLNSENIKHVFPNYNLSHGSMNEGVLKEIRPWLNSSDFDYEQTAEINLDPSQIRIVQNINNTKFRRVKGSAGSGKTLVAAARAATLASNNEKVFLCSFNITLKNYLRDCSMRYACENLLNKSCISKNVTFLNFHSWVKEVFLIYGSLEENRTRSLNTLDDHLINLILKKIIQEQPPNHEKAYLKYDAIIVDEGQDFSPEWWNILRSILAPDGEMLLVSDPTQDIYGTAKRWTDQSMVGAGFSGKWTKLEKAYRMPDELRELTNKFAETFLPNTGNENSENILTPIEELQGSFDLQVEHQPKVEMKWVMTGENDDPIEIFIHEIFKLRKRAEKLNTNFSMSDIVFLTGKKEIGRKVTEKFRDDYNIIVSSTFSENDVENRDEKNRFYKGAPNLKGVTIHSFKGLEGKAIALYIDAVEKEKDYRQIYTALTRLKKSERDRDLSFLLVVCCDEKFKNYSKFWRGRNVYRWRKNTEKIKYDQRGISYAMLFDDIFEGATQVNLVDPYIRNQHQFEKLEELLKTYRNANPNKEYLKFFLKTGSSDGSRQMSADQQQQKFATTKIYAEQMKIDFKWDIETGLHDRSMTTNLGWNVDLSRGIDIYQPPESGLDAKDYLKRKCHETKLTFHYEKIPLEAYEKL